VFAVSVLDVIRCAGGWLADRALAGWDVNVFLPEGDDGNPLRILGVSLHSLADIDSAGPAPYAPTAVAVSAAAICADPQIERRLRRQFTREIAEVTVWGQQVPDDIGAYLQSVQHVPSAAAAAFKPMRCARPVLPNECAQPRCCIPEPAMTTDRDWSQSVPPSPQRRCGHPRPPVPDR